jgi:hypothetical protein
MMAMTEEELREIQARDPDQFAALVARGREILTRAMLARTSAPSMSKQIHNWKPWTKVKPSRVCVLTVEVMLQAGSTLEEVGQRFGVTRERIRQIAKTHGIPCGRPTRTKLNADRRTAEKDQSSVAKWGCSVAEYRALGRPVTDAFQRQRQNASKRGIAWEFATLWEWWCVWRDSGKWAERGRKDGQYVMARRGDVGPYAPWNVEIKTSNENCAEGRSRILVKGE